MGQPVRRPHQHHSEIRLREQHRAEQVAKAALTPGGDLGFEVSAEGVKDDAIRERLIGLGYEVGQGYGLAHPMTDTDLADWLRGRTIAPA